MAIDTYALTTREAVQNYRVFQGSVGKTTPEIDALIDNLIDATSARIESYCNRKFLSRSYTEYYDGVGASTLYTDNYPILSVASIYDDAVWEWDVSTLITGTSYRIANSNSIVAKSGYSFSSGSQNIKITYTAGYTTVPYDIEHACVVEIFRVFDKVKDIGVFSRTTATGDTSTYVTNDFIDATKTTLDKYKVKAAF